MKFQLGKIVFTAAINNDIANDTVFAEEIISSFKRYAACDWGDTYEEDKLLNDEAVKCGDRILAVYKTSKGEVWFITEYDRSATTVLYPSEY